MRVHWHYDDRYETISRCCYKGVALRVQSWPTSTAHEAQVAVYAERDSGEYQVGENFTAQSIDIGLEAGHEIAVAYVNQHFA